MSIDPSEGLTPEQIQKLREAYLKTLPERLKAMEEAINGVKKEASAESVGALRFLVHKLAGNAGSFGYMEVSRLSKELEQELVAMIDSSAFAAIDLKKLVCYLEKIKGEFHFNG